MRSSFIIIISIVAFACSNGKESKEHSHAEKTSTQKYTCSMHPQIIRDAPEKCPICGMDLVPVSKGDSRSNYLMLNDSQIKLANITTEKVSFRPIGQTVIVNARLVENEELTEIISSRTAGRIEKLFVKETGRTIQKGEPLYEIYSETLLTLQKEYLLAKAQFEKLGSTEKRYGSFLKAAKRKLILFGLPQDQIDNLGKSRNVQERITFLSPASGILTELNIAEGQYVGEGEAIFQIENISKLWVEAELYPSETSFVKVGDKVKANISGFEDVPVEGAITFLSPEYRANTQITIVRAVIENPESRFKPGMQAQVFFTHSSREALSVPSDAVIRDGKGAHIYIQNGKNTFKAQMVKTGLEDFSHVEITEGLNEGDTVAVSGAYLLYSEIVLKKGGNPMAGHQHGNIEDIKMTENDAEPGRVNPEIREEQLTIDVKFSEQFATILLPYLKIKDALVASDMKSASTAGKDFSLALEKIDIGLLKGDAHMKWIEKLNVMQQSAKTIQSAGDIEKQRASFATLSDALYSSLKIFNAHDLHAYYQYCPMAFDNKGAYWISQDEQISNPYFGEQMLRCGETKEILK